MGTGTCGASGKIRSAGDFPELAAEIAAKSGQLPPCKPWSASLRARLGQCAAALAEKKAPTREAALAPLLDGLENAPDWRERHFALLLLKSEFEGPLGARMREAARLLAARGENTPDVLQARALLATVRSADSAADPGDAEAPIEAVALAETLLAAGVDVTTPERVLWETWAYSIRDCADNLARAGRKDEAIELYSGLIARLPGSKIADACATARGDLFHRKPLPLPGNAE